MQPMTGMQMHVSQEQKFYRNILSMAVTLHWY